MARPATGRRHRTLALPRARSPRPAADQRPHTPHTRPLPRAPGRTGRDTTATLQDRSRPAMPTTGTRGTAPDPHDRPTPALQRTRGCLWHRPPASTALKRHRALLRPQPPRRAEHRTASRRGPAPVSYTHLTLPTKRIV